MEYQYICEQCNKDFVTYYEKRGRRFFCCKKCANSGNLGSGNPNFGKKWNNEQRKKASNRVINEMKDTIRRIKSGKANRGKKFSQELIKKMHGNRLPSSYSHPHSEEGRKIIGKKSKAKFTLEFKKRMRELREANGTITKLHYLDSFLLYNNLSNWQKRMFDLTNIKGLEKLKEFGVYSTKNKKGVVRDHILSRRTGFENKVFPEILRHPCNCQILTHVENSKKQRGKNRTGDHQTLEELFNKICNYKEEWFEQEKCIELINKYKIGERYDKGQYIENWYLVYRSCKYVKQYV